ncbi:hypothetical protein ACSQ6I_07120 [Anabaena sp. WFMT]|uniref:hypothetical protein n=1 Tax=Anabaena sp. WFMT TaxID=3449730 RepID=UPI003F2054FA
MFGEANISKEYTDVKSIMACLVAIKLAPCIKEEELMSFLECVDGLNKSLIKYEEINDNDKDTRRDVKERIRDIGKSLNTMGGLKLMKLTYEFLTPSRKLSLILNQTWSGVGDWLA